MEGPSGHPRLLLQRFRLSTGALSLIASVRNKRVAHAMRLKKRALREKDRRFLVEGAQAVGEALSSAAGVEEVFCTAGSLEGLGPAGADLPRRGIPVRMVSEEVMRHLTTTVTPQGLVAVARFLDVPLSAIPAGATCVPVLVEVRDPGNAGTVLRSADAAGADAVVFTRSSVDVYNEKTVRATAGSLFHLPVVRGVATAEAVEHFRDSGFSVLAAAADGRRSVYEADLTAPTILLFGNEAHGLPAEVATLADETIRVPILGPAESLNLAAAAAVILFEVARQRTAGASMGRIVSRAAHDIRSPLTAVRSFASTLLSRWDRLADEQRLAMIQAIVHDSSRMAVVVTRLVDAARLVSGDLRLSTAPIDVRDLAATVQREMTEWGSIEVALSGDSSMPATASVDPERLRTILIAMVEVARWFGSAGPVHMEVRSGEEIAVRVWRSSDRQGFLGATELLDTASAHPGASLALFVAQGLAEAHRGTLTTDVGGEVSLTLVLPN